MISLGVSLAPLLHHLLSCCSSWLKLPSPQPRRIGNWNFISQTMTTCIKSL